MNLYTNLIQFYEIDLDFSTTRCSSLSSLFHHESYQIFEKHLGNDERSFLVV